MDLLRQAGGVKPMHLEGRGAMRRERLAGMTHEERLYRKQWLSDQVLTPREPVFNPKLWKEFRNPIRRFYRFPLDYFQNWATFKIGGFYAFAARSLIASFLIGYAGLHAALYYGKYNHNVSIYIYSHGTKH